MAALAAGIVVCIRLAAATPLAVPPPAAPATRDGVVERTPEPAEMPRDLLLPEKNAALVRWMEEHPDQMMDGIDRMEDREQAAALAKVLVEAVGGMHYDLLLDWLARQKDPKLAALVFRGLIPRLIRENPDQCISIAFALGHGEEARLARDEFFFALPLEQRVRLVKRLGPEERAWLLSRRATGFGERAPELCLEMIRELPEFGHTREALAKLVKAWAGGANVYHLADPMSAVRGVMTIENAEMRRQGLRVATFEWSGPDPDLAAAWVNKLPAGPDRDAAIEGMVKRFSADHPERAQEWAAAITDETLRRKASEEAAQKKTSAKDKEKEKETGKP
ncbi:hypothetical protein GCM10023212_33570 [Luteolibacter yonseiensis]